MKNFNSILSILLPELVKYENTVHKIYIVVDETLKQHSNLKYNTYNSNKLLITDKLTQLQQEIQDIYLIISAIDNIYNVKQLIDSNFEIVTTKPVLHTIKNQYSETKTTRIDKKILTATNVINNIAKCEHMFINELVQLFIEYFQSTGTYINNLLLDIPTHESKPHESHESDGLSRSSIYDADRSDPGGKSDLNRSPGDRSGEQRDPGGSKGREGHSEVYSSGYMNKIIIGIISLYKYDPEYSERNKQITQSLYTSIYDSAGFTDIANYTDVWYDSSLQRTDASSGAVLRKQNGVIYKLNNLLTPQIPALHNVNGISDSIVAQFNTIVITPNSEVSKYKIIRNYDNIYVRNYLRESLMNTENIKFTNMEMFDKNYTEWKETMEMEPNILIQILTKNFGKLLEQSKIETLHDFVNLAGCVLPSKPGGVTVSMDYKNYIVQSFSEFYFENVTRLVAAQFVSSHTNTLFDDQVSSGNNFMKEAYISNLINIKTSATTLRKKIVDAANNTYRSEVYIILKYNNKNSDAWLTLFKTMIKSIIDPGKNVKSKFVEKMNVLIPKAGLKHFIMKNPNSVFKLNI